MVASESYGTRTGRTIMPTSSSHHTGRGDGYSTSSTAYHDRNSAEQDHWSERGRVTSVGNADALDRPRRSILALGPHHVSAMKRYMVIETFLPGCKGRIYERFHAKGGMLPEGLAYLNSWLEQNGDRCFQLMETSDPSLY